MALHALDLARVKAMSDKQRLNYFANYAGHIVDSPKLCYAIRVGSTTLTSSDTYDLRVKFEEFLGPRVPFRKNDSEFLRENGWTRAYYIPYALSQKHKNTIWWTKSDDSNAVPQGLAVRQQRRANAKAEQGR